MSRLVSRAELARVAGVSDAAVSKACKHALSAACVGKRVDLDHPAAHQYLSNKGVAPTATPARAEKRAPTPPPVRPVVPIPDAIPALIDGFDPEDFDMYADFTLRQLTDRFGTATRFKDWLDARKKIADIREKDLKNEETEGRLIPREPVQTHVFGAIEAANQRLLRDVPKTIARLLYAAAKSGVPVEDAERTVRDAVTSILQPVKATAARVLRGA